MKKIVLFSLLYSNLSFAGKAYILKSRVCADGQSPQDTIINEAVSLNFKSGTFRLAGILEPGTSFSRPFVLEAKVKLTKDELVLSPTQTFDAGARMPRIIMSKWVMKRKPNIMEPNTLEFSYNSNPTADGSCRKGVPMIFTFTPAPF